MRLPLAAAACLLAIATGAAARSPGWPPEVDAALSRFQASTGTPNVSLRLARPEGEVYRAHRGSFGDDTVMPIASASKWLSALVLARLVERGVLRWDSTVGEWFPEAPPATHAITLAQLYSHTSGIAITDAGCLSDRDSTLDACALDILSRPLAWPPGSTFAYGGNSMQVGGAMAERASGRRWDALFLAEVVGPLGLRSTDWVALAPQPGYVANPNPRVAGGARSTLSDYSIVLDMVLQGGRHAGSDYLQPQTLAEMAVDRARPARGQHAGARPGLRHRPVGGSQRCGRRHLSRLQPRGLRLHALGGLAQRQQWRGGGAGRWLGDARGPVRAGGRLPACPRLHPAAPSDAAGARHPRPPAARDCHPRPNGAAHPARRPPAHSLA